MTDAYAVRAAAARRRRRSRSSLPVLRAQGGRRGHAAERRPAGPPERTLTVFAAASLQKPFEEIGATFEDAHPGVTVRFSFGGSSGLVAQLADGAPADVLATANERDDGQGRRRGPRHGRARRRSPPTRSRSSCPADNPAGVRVARRPRRARRPRSSCARPPSPAAPPAPRSSRPPASTSARSARSSRSPTCSARSARARPTPASSTSPTSSGAGDEVTGIDFPEAAVGRQHLPDRHPRGRRRRRPRRRVRRGRHRAATGSEVLPDAGLRRTVTRPAAPAVPRWLLVPAALGALFVGRPDRRHGADRRLAPVLAARHVRGVDRRPLAQPAHRDARARCCACSSASRSPSCSPAPPAPPPPCCARSSSLPLVIPPVVGGIALLQAFGRRGLLGDTLDVLGLAGRLLDHGRRHRPDLRRACRSSSSASRAPCAPPAPATRTSPPRSAPARRRSSAGSRSPWRCPASSPAPSSRSPAASVSSARRSPSPGRLQGTTRTLPLEIYLQREGDPRAAVALSLVLVAVAVLVIALTRARRDSLAEGAAVTRPCTADLTVARRATSPSTSPSRTARPLALLGPNGAGKSTVLAAARRAPASGRGARQPRRPRSSSTSGTRTWVAPHRPRRRPARPGRPALPAPRRPRQRRLRPALRGRRPRGPRTERRRAGSRRWA